MATGQIQTPKGVYYFRLLRLLIDGGTPVIRKILDQHVNVPLTVHISNNHRIIIQLKSDHVISKTLLKKLLYGNPSSADLDISLLTCLLQSICGLKGPNDPVWKSVPGMNDLSLEADIVRLRNVRNELQHKKEILMLEKDFCARWAELEAILLRLNGRCNVPDPNLQATISQWKNESIDEDMEKKFDELLNDWDEKDKAMKKELDNIKQALQRESTQSKAVEKKISDMGENINRLQQKCSPRLESLKALSEQYFNQAEVAKDRFYRTSNYRKASEHLTKTGIVVLSGYPGEGKTTMAKYLLLDTTPIQKILKLSTPQDWEHLSVKDCSAIFIDDIFGSEMLEESAVKEWKKYLSEIDTATRNLKLNVVITTRDYILKGAKERFKLDLFKDENVTMLSSSDLSDDEKKNILKLHLDSQKRSFPTWLVDCCVTEWNYDQSKVGFPECAVMFATNDKVFGKGPEFFARPFEFFRKCLSELLKHEEESFSVLILLWANGSKAISKYDLNPKNLKVFEDIEVELDCSLRERSKSLRESLDRYNDGYLVKNEKTEEYTFSHSFISDVVGLVASDEYPDLVIKYASKSFTMNYIRTTKTELVDSYLLVDKKRYPVLREKLHQLLFKNKELSWDCHLESERLNAKGIENMRIAESGPDVGILTHEAFTNQTFVQDYTEPCSGTDFVSTPILEVFEHFRNPYCISFEYGKMGMCLPTFFLARQNAGMVEEYIKLNSLTEREKYIALLLATRDKNGYLVRKLINIGTPVNEDSLQIATVNQDKETLSLLLTHFTKNTGYELIQKASSPLMTAAKRGFLDMVDFWLKTDVDVNYRNKDGLSALDKAVIGNRIDICKALIQKGCDLDVKSGWFKRTPLHKAADMGLVEITELLLNAGASVDTQDHRGEYPIHSAALHGHTKITRLLLQKDKSLAEKTINFKGKVNFRNFSLFHYAVWKEDESLLKLLREFKVDPNIQDGYGRTPLYLATYYNKAKFVKMLLDFADVRKPERSGYSPLHAAALQTNPKIVRLLCGSYNDIRLVDRKGNTVFHILKRAEEKAKDVRSREYIVMPDKISKCVKYLLETDPGFQEVLATMKNKRGEIVSVKFERNFYSLVTG